MLPTREESEGGRLAGGPVFFPEGQQSEERVNQVAATFFYTNQLLGFGVSVNALVLGQTGLEKSSWVSSVIDDLGHGLHLPPEERKEALGRVVRHFDIEEGIKTATGQATLQAYLEAADSKGREALWKKSAEGILQEVQSKKSRSYIVSAHAAYYRRHQFFGAISHDTLKEFGFSVILTLIDDVEDIVCRINRQRPAVGLQTRSHLTLAEALAWRSVEITMGDFLARALNVTNHVIPVKHPVSTGRDLMFDAKALRVYASYPITSTREQPGRVDEINTHRALLHSKFCIFDPVTIDEYRVISGSGPNLIRGARWPLGSVTPAVSPVDAKHRDLEADRIDDSLLESISAQVASRDYRMIDQANVVVAYRPFFGARPNMSSGVQGEMVYAVEHNKTVYLYDPPEDRSGDRDRSIFGVLEKTIPFEDRNELYRELDKLQAERRK